MSHWHEESNVGGTSLGMDPDVQGTSLTGTRPAAAQDLQTDTLFFMRKTVHYLGRLGALCQMHLNRVIQGMPQQEARVMAWEMQGIIPWPGS